MHDLLRLAVVQHAPELADPTLNGDFIQGVVESADVDLVVFPELALTGYALGLRPARFERATSASGGLFPTPTCTDMH